MLRVEQKRVMKIVIKLAAATHILPDNKDPFFVHERFWMYMASSFYKNCQIMALTTIHSHFLGSKKWGWQAIEHHRLIMI